MPDFYYFGASKKWGEFSPIMVLAVLILMPGTKQQLTNRQRMRLDGVCNASWLWRVDWTNMGTIFVSELVPHIPASEQPFWQ